MLRGFLSLTLSLMLVATSHSMAQARGANPAVDRMVICAGAQAVVVYVDASGAPTHAPHMCPDCALQGWDAVPGASFDLWCAPVFSYQGADTAALAVRLSALSRAQARAPPVWL